MNELSSMLEALLARLRPLAGTDPVDLAWRSAAAVLVVAAIYFGLSRLIKAIAARLLRAGTDDAARVPHAELLRMLGRTMSRTSSLFLAVAALTSGGALLPLPPALHGLLHSAFIVAFVLQAAIWAAVVLTAWLEGLSAGTGEDRRALSSATAIIGTLARLALWTFAVVLILDNLGFNVTALVAGLGIGGIAVGLAAQKILGDLFASLAILLDKPFEYGDFIVAGQQMGTVERIGLKTTRLRSLSGEQLVIANADLLESRIQNFKRMGERRVLFKVGIVYGTAAEKLEAIPPLIRRAIEAQPRTRFDRSHLASFDPMQLTFESVYYVLTPDFGPYMDVHQNILLALYRELAAQGICFALPAGNAAAPMPVPPR